MKLKELVKYILKLKKEKPEDQQIEVQERKNMMDGIEELSETLVREVMVPRIDVVFISDTISYEQLKELIQEEGFSRYPVYSETIDNVVGILYVKDIIASNFEIAAFDVKLCMRQP